MHQHHQQDQEAEFFLLWCWDCVASSSVDCWSLLLPSTLYRNSWVPLNSIMMLLLLTGFCLSIVEDTTFPFFIYRINYLHSADVFHPRSKHLADSVIAFLVDSRSMYNTFLSSQSIEYNITFCQRLKCLYADGLPAHVTFEVFHLKLAGSAPDFHHHCSTITVIRLWDTDLNVLKSPANAARRIFVQIASVSISISATWRLDLNLTKKILFRYIYGGTA